MVEQRARGRAAEHADERVTGRLGDENDVRLVEIAAEARRPTLEVAARASARELLEEVLDQVLLRELLDHLDLLDADRDLAGDGTGELDANAAVCHEQPDELAVHHERNREASASASSRELGAELGEAERLSCIPGLGGARLPIELLARGIEKGDVARTGCEKRARGGDDRLQQVVERLSARNRLRELRQLLELGHSESGLLVETRVLDRARDERRRRHEEVDLVIRELARSLGVGGDHTDRFAGTIDERHCEQRLEPLLLELRNVFRPRIGEGLVADERWLAVLRSTPGKALTAFERDLADLTLVGRGRGAQDEERAVVLGQVGKAG